MMRAHEGTAARIDAATQRAGSSAGRRVAAVLACIAMFASGVAPAAAQEVGASSTTSELRVGVLALADAIAAVGRTPDFAEPLPYTRTSIADVLQLDDVVTTELIGAMAGTDLKAALEKVRGIIDVEVEGTEVSFAYEQSETVALELAYDDGDLRFGPNSGAGDLTVSLATPTEGERFVVEVDPDQPDPLLRFALISQPVLELSVDIATPSVTAFTATEGFTEIDVTGGDYTVHREAVITLRDPNGRGLLTLEDLRYSNLVDLYRIDRDAAADNVDIEFDVELPTELAGGDPAQRTGTRTLSGVVPTSDVWPDPADASETYGSALEAATDLTLADGITALAEYTGTALVLQDAADVDFPNLGGGITDLFAPADELLDMLATSAVADIRCGLTPDNPPTGTGAPGDTVYCDAVTATGLPKVASAVWSLADTGTVATADAASTTAVGTVPAGTVRIDGSDGQPDVVLVLTLEGGTTMTARPLPRTIQDVSGRIEELGSPDGRTATSAATVNLAADRLDVTVALGADGPSADLPVGDPATLGALVGLTGLTSGSGAATATASATDASFDVGFGIPLGVPLEDTGVPESIELLPADTSLFTVATVDADPPDLTGLTGRIGFLGVAVDITELTLGGGTATDPVVALSAPTAAAIDVSDLLTDEGTLSATSGLTLVSKLTASIGFEATELALPGTGDFATGGTAAVSGVATVSWAPGGLPTVGLDAEYDLLRVFDPVPAAFLTGTATVTKTTTTYDDAAGVEKEADDDMVELDITGLGTSTLYAELLGDGAVATPGIEVARRLVGTGVSCQNVTIVDDDTLTCEGLAPGGSSAFADLEEAVDVIVLGDPFALRDGIIDGLATSLNEFQRLAGDNVPEDEDFDDDQYTSTLALVDLTPAQLAVEREDLAAGIGAIVAAATADEAGTSTDADPGTDPAFVGSVSSAQELSAFAAAEFGAGGLGFTVGTAVLDVTLTAAAPGDKILSAPLRFSVDGTGQVLSESNVTVNVASATTLATQVAVATARPGPSALAASTSTATMDTSSELEGKLRAGAGELTVKTGSTAVDADPRSTATLGVTVATERDPDTDKLTTTRTGDGADASLVTERDDPLVYTALATESSGGTGTEPDAPEAMQVKFLAEGLDGLASALGGALDGASPRVTGPEGIPVAAPLIGSDLDAGADVAEILTDLTSDLRDRLDLVAVTGALTAADLEPAVEDAVDAALESSDDVSGTPAEATVVYDGSDNDDPTGWDSLSVTTTLTGEERDGETEFSIGLAGVNVRSDQPIDTTTIWTLPITLELVRGVGPQITIGATDTLELDVAAALPAVDKVSKALGTPLTTATCRTADHAQCIPAIIGYLPGMLTTTNTTQGSMATTVSVALPKGSYDLFELYDGIDAIPSFVRDETKVAPDVAEDEGLKLGFETVASDFGSFDLTGTINVPWTAEGGSFQGNDPKTTVGGFEEVTYTGVKLDVGEVIATLATPFDVIDPYLAPVRDVIDVLRTPIPVVSDISELGGGDEVSLLSIVEDLQGGNPKLDLAIRIANFIETVVTVVEAIAVLASPSGVDLDDLSKVGTLLTVEPSKVALAGSCTETVTTTKTPPPTTGDETTTTTEPKPKPKKATAACPAEPTNPGARKQTTAEKRRGTRTTATSVGTKTKGITGSAPGFSLPFLADPDQIVDVLTGEGEATYFRLDLGTLVAEVAYTRKFGPIMAGPVPIVPFVGGSISLEGRMAAGFDSMPQTLAVRSVAAGDIAALMTELGSFDGEDGGDIIREGFYLDDLDAEGVDVPEIKLVTTLEAGAGVSIGIVTAGLKGGVTLTINIDMNDPNDDGKIRTAEIRTMFAGNPACLFDVTATLQAFLQIFVEIELFVTTKKFAFDLVRLGPYTLFEYGCPDVVPTLVVVEAGNLALTSGSRSGQRNADTYLDVPENYEVRQFDTGGGAAAIGGTTTYEIDAIDRVQRVVVRNGIATIYKAGVALSTEVQSTVSVSGLRFVADGHQGTDDKTDDAFSFLLGETFDSSGNLVSTPFTTPVTLDGRGGDDTLVTGDGDDIVTGGAGNDGISTGAGNDVADGGAGHDLVDGGSGHDDLKGSGGNDRLEGGPGADRLSGGDGNDALIGGTGRDVRALLLDDGDGDSDGDIPSVQEQVDVGFDSGDVLVGGPGADVVDGGDGADVVVGGDASVLTGAVLSTLFETDTGGRKVNVLNKTSREITTPVVDISTAKVPSDETVDGLCVSETLETSVGGGDVVTGGPEDDIVIGGNGSDDLDGGGGSDQLCGRHGDDSISGDGGAPPLDAGDDVVRGGHGNDMIDTGLGDDLAYGDDADLYRSGALVLDGTLGTVSTTGDGNDYITTGDGDDLIAGGGGSDLLRGGAGDDRVYGEAADTVDVGGDAPSVADRLIACNPATRIVNGAIDLNGDLLAGPTTVTGAESDDGRLAGLEVTTGVLYRLGTGTTFTGLIGGEVVVIDGLVDLDRDGKVGAADTDGGDTGTVGLASMMATTATNSDGDCILGEDGDDDLRGGAGSDHISAGAGIDLVTGGDGNDLLLGDAGTDVIVGGPHHDVLVGGEGDDHLVGGQGDDRLRGNDGDDDLIGGTDADGASDGQDVLLGGRGMDVLAGENATLVSDAIVTAIDGAPWIDDAIVPTATLAGDESASRHDDGAVTCDGDVADRWVTLLTGPEDEERIAVASPGGPVRYDELFGGFGCDWVFGQEGDDLVRGGQDDDVVEGGPGADTGYGDAGHDVVIGGSSVDAADDGTIVAGRSGEGAPDGNDMLFGDGGPDGLVGDDVIVGDNATPVFVHAEAEPTVVQIVLADVLASGTQIDETISSSFGDDVIGAGGGDDRVFGQSGNDTIHGEAGDDDLQGNAGDDTIFGDDGQDRIVGGSAADQSGPDGADLQFSDVLDGGDQLTGGGGADWIAGDNALISPVGEFDLVDVALVTDDLPATDVAGADVIFGDRAPTGNLSEDSDGADVIYGQSGDDEIDGQEGDDTIDGNAGDDTLLGGPGDDALVGGSSADDGASTAVEGPGAGRRLLVDTVDGADTIYGGEGVDVVLGDNGVIAGHGTSATWRLYDVDLAHPDSPTTDADAFGNDLLFGDGGTDVLIAQAGDDQLSGGDADDSLHGGPGADILQGDAGADDLIGGSSHHWVEADRVRLRTVLDEGDLLFGSTPDAACTDALPDLEACEEAVTSDPDGAGHGDVIIGDNGEVTRGSVPGADARATQDVDTDVNTGDPVRSVVLYDVDMAPGAAYADPARVEAFPAAASGDDAAFGGSGRDRIFGQAGDDVLIGQEDDDEIEGNGGADRIVGGEGSDDLIGGSSSDDAGTVQAGAFQFPGTGSDVADGNDTIVAGAGDDVALGDNGLIERRTDADWDFHAAPYGHVRRSTVEVAFAFELDGAFGDDFIDAGAGHDDVRGQLGHDTLHGREGDDTLIGDLGRLRESAVLSGPTGAETIPADALNEPVYRKGSLYRVVELFERVGTDPEKSTSLRTGDDTITGGAGNDAIHAGSGDDIVNGHGDIDDDGVPGKGPDVVAVQAIDTACGQEVAVRLVCDEDDIFAGHGEDKVWGGPGHDRLFGGHNADELDVIRAGSTAPFANPDVDYVGADLIFGGWGPDVMQADRSDNGPDPGDRLIDSAGVYNAYFVCDGGLGDVTAIRRMSPAIVTFLDKVAVAAGAYDAASSKTAGWWALANIFKKDVNSNNTPAHPENPGNFVCNETETTTDPEPTAPVAAFSWICTDLACTFTDESTSPLTDPAWMYAWDFGDGGTSTEQNPPHEFTEAGLYQVQLVVTAGGVEDSVSHDVQIGEPEPVPITLTAVGDKVKGSHVVDLEWTGASGAVDIWRDGAPDDAPIAEDVDGPTYRDELPTKESGSYTYRVCDAGSEANCSADVTVTF